MFLSSLLDDPRIHDIAASICGDDFNYTSGDGNYYAGDTRWHSDGYNADRVLSIKIAFYLDPLTRDSGALRVIPGSHRAGDAYADALEKDIRESGKIWGLEGPDVPALILQTTPGDIVVFNHNLKHAAFGGSQRRRMYTMNFSRRYPEHRLEELREVLGREARFWIDRIHGEAMIATAGPERMVHLEQVRANDTHLAELTRELKKDNGRAVARLTAQTRPGRRCKPVHPLRGNLHLFPRLRAQVDRIQQLHERQALPPETHRAAARREWPRQSHGSPHQSPRCRAPHSPPYETVALGVNCTQQASRARTCLSLKASASTRPQPSQPCPGSADAGPTPGPPTWR